MIRIKYLKSASLAELQREIPNILTKYRQPHPFLHEFYSGNDDWLAESNLTVEDLPILNPGNDGASETESAILLHKALKGLTESQAADERLWAWLGHCPYWDYMRQRWPAEGNRSGDLASYVREHYFLGSNVRNLMRQGIARLWWFANTTIDETREDPYELTRVMLEYSDNRQSLMETGYSRNRMMVQTILGRAAHWRSEGRDVLKSRDNFRLLCKELNLYGGTLVLDCVPKEDIIAMIDDFMVKKVPEADSGKT